MRIAVLVAVCAASCVPRFEAPECFSDRDCPARAACRDSLCSRLAPDAAAAPDVPDPGDATLPDAGDAGVPADTGTTAADAGALDARVDTGPRDSAFPYVPRNFDPIDPDVALGALTLASGCILDVDRGTLTSTPAPGDRCERVQPILIVPTSSTVVVHLGRLEIGPRARLTLTGSAAAILAVYGDVVIEGDVDAAGRFGRSGPGANQVNCGPGRGRRGASSPAAMFLGGGGGGGGGFGDPGGAGGAITQGAMTVKVAGGEGGTAWMSPELSPLLGGCAGGTGGTYVDAMSATGAGGRGGGGGGAFQISASGTMRIAGHLLAGGGAGRGGAFPGGGGGGGGSGGAILLEADRLMFESSARVNVPGAGGGGAGSRTMRGEDGKVMEDHGDGGKGTAPAGDGGDGGGGPGTSGQNNAMFDMGMIGGGGGGGGGMGRIELHARTCTRGGAHLNGRLSGVECR